MIGIFDSGVGGMTVARAVEQILPDAPILYLGDIARTPYGTKSSRTIIDYSVENTKFLIGKGARIIIIACNSASSVATQRLRQEFDVPIIEVITPAVHQALRKTKTGRIGVIGTRATIRSDIYQRTIIEQEPGNKVFSVACPLLVPLVEEDWISKRETKMILRRYLHPLKNEQIDTLVLACTHYPLLKKLIQPRIGKQVSLIDSSVEIALYLKTFLQENKSLLKPSKHSAIENSFFVTDLTESVQNVATKIFQRDVQLQRV